MRDIRDIFFLNVRNRFLKDKKLRILTNDADVFALQRLRGHKRYIDAGVAEQNLINISAGFSRKNFKSVVYGFCTFLTLDVMSKLDLILAA